MTLDSFNDQIIELNSDLEKAYKQWENIVIPEKHIRKIHLEIDELALKYGWVWVLAILHLQRLMTYCKNGQ